jgi:hypothetical protein
MLRLLRSRVGGQLAKYRIASPLMNILPYADGTHLLVPSLVPELRKFESDEGVSSENICCTVVCITFW